jgi:tetratricopeptide (TPR) repeat protein
MKSKNLVISSLKLLTALALLTVSIFGQSRQVREQAKTLQDQGDRSFAQKNYRDAADKYAQALVLIPNNAYGHYRKGFAHFNLQERDQAINEFTIALSQGFRPVEVFRVRAFIYFEQKNYDAALDDIKKGLVLAPKDVLFLKGLGEVYLAKNDFQQAIEALRRAADVAPNDADVQYNMARVHFATGDVKAQQAAAESALARGTRFPGEAHYLLGDAYQKMGNATAAISSYQRAISSKPDIYQAHRNLADVFRNEGRFNDAITTSKQALITFPNDGNIYTDLSWYYSLADRAEDAVQAAKAGIQLLPNQYTAYTNLCRAHNQKQEYALAVNACNSALRLQPNDGETYYYLGNALVGLDKSVEATRMYTRAVTGLTDYTAKNPGYSDGWYLLGNASFADKQYDKAIDAYQKCLALSPKFLKARVNLGITYTRKKNKAAATEQYNLLLAADKALADRLKAEIDRM